MHEYLKKIRPILFLAFFFLVSFLFLPPRVLGADPVGIFDSADCNQITGWSVDPNYLNSPSQVAIFDGGPAGTGTLLGYVTANQPRSSALCQAIGGQNCSICNSDPSQPQCAHGFVFQTPNSIKDGQTHSIYVHGMHIDNQGTNPLLQLNPKTITCSLGDGTISKDVLGSPLTIKTQARWAGAIDSMIWKGKEFVLSVNNGQQIQVAMTVNNYGQCYNPTESGSAKDYKGPSTSSKLLSFSVNNNVIETTNQMAFWLDPSVNSTDPGCVMKKNPPFGDPWWPGYPFNENVLSNFILHKKITIGYRDLPNVIVHEAIVDIPTNLNINMTRFNQTMAQIPSDERNNDASLRYIILENPAVYVPITFSVRYLFDPKLPPVKSSLLRKADHEYDSFTIPPILTTPDEQYAIGLYRPDVVMSGYPNHEQNPFIGYELDDWSNSQYFGENVTMLMGARIPYTPINNKVTSQSFLVVGTLADVQTSMHRLYEYFNSSTTPSFTPIPPTSTPAPILGDLNGDRVVNNDDLQIFLSDFTTNNLRSDINKNNKVDIFDYNILVENFGKTQ